MEHKSFSLRSMGDLAWRQPPSKRTRLAERKPHPGVIRPKPMYAALPLVELAPPNYDALSSLQHRAYVEQQQQTWETQWHGSMLGQMPPGTFLATVVAERCAVRMKCAWWWVRGGKGEFAWR